MKSGGELIFLVHTVFPRNRRHVVESETRTVYNVQGKIFTIVCQGLSAVAV